MSKNGKYHIKQAKHSIETMILGAVDSVDFLFVFLNVFLFKCRVGHTLN